MKVASFIVFLIFMPLVYGKQVSVLRHQYVPVFRDPGEADTEVGPILVDETPVTNSAFLQFVKAHPEFSRSKISPLFADGRYLSQWTSDVTFVHSESDYPVTQVSWFVARRYCAAQGQRLPTIAEWEVFSEAQNPALEAGILEWYGRPGTRLRSVGKERANRFGIKDAHGLIWEWVDNFGESILSGDSRGGSSTDSLFCGGAALKAKDPRLYAAFMRFAFRSSLTASYNSEILGFRCVQDLKENHK